MKIEKLEVKNFGPIAKAEIEIKPFMVFVGESGSGKSVILKLLSLFRWIIKKSNFKILSKSIGVKEELYRFKIDRMLRESGLEDFCIKGSEAHYYINNICISLTYDGKPNLKFPKQLSNKLSIEKNYFITNDRFTIPMFLNNQVLGKLPHHLEKIFYDFVEAFEYLQTNNKVRMNIFDIELSLEKYGIQNNYFINLKNTKTKLHNASSGMKSASIIELISTYFATDNEYMKNQYTDFILDAFSKLKNKNPNDFLENVKNIKLSKERLSLFIEEPELSLFPNAQKQMVEYLVNLCFNFNTKRDIYIAFSTHSPYLLSSLNCLLKAYQVAKIKGLKNKVEKIVSSKYWLNINNFSAFNIKNGRLESIIDKDVGLISADNIDEVSEEINDIFQTLLDYEFGDDR